MEQPDPSTHSTADNSQSKTRTEKKVLCIPQYHLLGYPGRCADCKRASKHSGENGKRKAHHKEAEWREKAKANGVSAQTCRSLVAAPLQTDLPQDLGNVARCRHNALQRQQHCNILSCLCILHAFTNDLSRNPANIFRNQLAQHSSSQPTCYTPTILFDCILCLFHSYTALCYASRIKYLHSNKSFTVGLITKSDFTCSIWTSCMLHMASNIFGIDKKSFAFSLGNRPFTKQTICAIFTQQFAAANYQQFWCDRLALEGSTQVTIGPPLLPHLC